MGKKLTAFLLFFVLCSAGHVARAGNPPPPPPENDSDVFVKFDRNGNNVIDPEEFPGTEQRFHELDANGDGLLSREELSSKNPQLPGNNAGNGGPERGGKGPDGDGFSRDDRNGDGKVTREEFSGPPEMFAKMDINNDDVLTRDEVTPPDRPGSNGKGKRGGIF